MSRDARLLLEDIAESCAKVHRYTEGLGRDAVLTDEMRFDGVLRNLQVIGEAVKKLPPALRDRYPDVPWRKVAGLRDFVSHAYFALDLEILWDAIQRDVPALRVRVEEILQLEISSQP